MYLDISPFPPSGLVLRASKLSPMAPIKRKGACRKYCHKAGGKMCQSLWHLQQLVVLSNPNLGWKILWIWNLQVCHDFWSLAIGTISLVRNHRLRTCSSETIRNLPGFIAQPCHNFVYKGICNSRNPPRPQCSVRSLWNIHESGRSSFLFKVLWDFFEGQGGIITFQNGGHTSCSGGYQGHLQTLILHIWNCLAIWLQEILSGLAVALASNPIANTSSAQW